LEEIKKIRDENPELSFFLDALFSSSKENSPEEPSPPKEEEKKEKKEEVEQKPKKFPETQKAKQKAQRSEALGYLSAIKGLEEKDIQKALDSLLEAQILDRERFREGKFSNEGRNLFEALKKARTPKEILDLRAPTERILEKGKELEKEEGLSSLKEKRTRTPSHQKKIKRSIQDLPGKEPPSKAQKILGGKEIPLEELFE